MRSTRSFRAVVVCIAFVVFGCGKTFPEEEVPNTFELRAGTQIEVVPKGSVATIQVGDMFAGTLTRDLHYRSDAVDEDGRPFEREVLVAAAGSVVNGIAVEPEAADEAVGLRLTSVTFHGGKSFPVATDVVAVNLNPPEGIETAAPMRFKLTEPADVALVIEYRRTRAEELGS